ncbi:unnamed protein product [Clonostachys chloroleuca]|uniref:Crh-like protein n=1 Tax=Clonostachys chloroleuca TaxID=1926264 RepID=A0AA35Q3R8_9HYPO|nr:unnamed protein product [Clonostachys chloroleuca]
MIAKALVASIALAASVSAQTFTDCNPLEKDCPAAAALGTQSIDCDLTQGACAGFNVLEGTTLTYDSKGALFSIENDKQAPTIASSRYIFFGRLEVVAQAAPGRGLVTSIVLQSADLDEIDWEWLGYDEVNVQTNYFGKGDTTVYDRGAFHKVSAPLTTFHTYTIEWTASKLDWIIDGQVVRTLNYADAASGTRYPQTPMQVKLGTWVAGLPGNSQGTIDWAGGLTDFSQAPFNAWYKSIKVVDYAGGSAAPTESIREYQYGDRTGSWESIVIVKGEPIPLSSAITTPGASTPVSTNTPASSYTHTGPFNSSFVAHPTPTGGDFTTSTVYGTTVYVTSCAPTVTNCPAGGSTKVTETIAISTTVCPIGTGSNHVSSSPSATSGNSPQQPSSSGISVTSGNSPQQPSATTGPASPSHTSANSPNKPSSSTPSGLITATSASPVPSHPHSNSTASITSPSAVPTAGAAQFVGSLSLAAGVAAAVVLFV